VSNVIRALHYTQSVWPCYHPTLGLQSSTAYLRTNERTNGFEKSQRSADRTYPDLGATDRSFIWIRTGFVHNSDSSTDVFVHQFASGTLTVLQICVSSGSVSSASSQSANASSSYRLPAPVLMLMTLAFELGVAHQHVIHL